MTDYEVGYNDGLAWGLEHPDTIACRISVTLADGSSVYDVGYVAGLAAAKVRAGEDG